MMTRHKFLSAVCVVVALVGAACSSSGGKPSSGSSSQAGAAPIKVGVICTCSGGGGFGVVLEPGLRVYKAWASSVNAAGGINGHPVQLITKDDAGNPSKAQAAATELVSAHVVAVADISLLD